MDEDARGHWETTYYGDCDIRVSIRIGDNIPHDDAIDFIERHCSEPIRVVSVEVFVFAIALGAFFIFVNLIGCNV